MYTAKKQRWPYLYRASGAVHLLLRLGCDLS